ncbi:MAG: hypothetical protein ABSG05_02785 [Candidatus Pacearchaeota archaeon]|jgi:hypothetical protein
MKIPILIVKLLFLGALFIISNQNLHLAVSTERQTFFQDYSAWLGNLFNKAVDVTSYVIKVDWLPEKNMNAASNPAVNNISNGTTG